MSALSILPSFLLMPSRIHGMASAFEVSMFTCTRHHFPRRGQNQKQHLAWMLHGTFTPPRISPSCPHCLRLCLDRSIRIGKVLAIQPATVCFLSRWTRFAPSLAVIYAGLYPLHRWSLRISQRCFSVSGLPMERISGSGYAFFKVHEKKVLS